jgi:hypothetical protein
MNFPTPKPQNPRCKQARNNQSDLQQKEEVFSPEEKKIGKESDVGSVIADNKKSVPEDYEKEHHPIHCEKDKEASEEEYVSDDEEVSGAEEEACWLRFYQQGQKFPRCYWCNTWKRTRILEDPAGLLLVCDCCKLVQPSSRWIAVANERPQDLPFLARWPI